MNIVTLVILSIALAMDAFAVSVSEGIAVKKIRIKHFIIVGGIFGLFQAIMPLFGYVGGNYLYKYISRFSHWITFLLLLIIGGKMIYEAYSEDECEKKGKCELNSNLILLAVATSIDAFAIGFSLALVRPDNIYFIISVIGLITFFICCIGVYLGNKLGRVLSSKSEVLGGIILILIGIKALIEKFI